MISISLLKGKALDKSIQELVVQVAGLFVQTFPRLIPDFSRVGQK
jgi:hypothetical protein